MADIHILGFAGTLRKNSYNKGLLREAQNYLPEGVALEITELDDLPLFNQDLENEPPAPVRAFREKVQQADAILMAVPEYNYSFTGVLKNALDWGSRPPTKSVWAGKPAALMGAGGRMGTSRAQLQLRQVLLYLNMPTLIRPEVLIQNSWERFDSEGNLINEQSKQQVEALISAFVRFIEHNKRT